MDQTLEIINDGPSAVIPTLDITPIDFSGAALPAVTVRTAYGTDHGKMVVPAGERSLDVLAFTGDDVTRVVDVKVSVRAMTNVVFPVAPHLATAQALNDAEQPTTKFGPFDAVALTNPNSEAISVGVVCIIWAQPPAGQPQQARRVIPLGVATIAGNGTATIHASGAVRQTTRYGCGSLKVFFSPPSGTTGIAA